MANDPEHVMGQRRPAMVDTAPLFAGLHEQLMDLLRRLGPDDWQRPTVAGAWRVRDVVAHLIDGQTRRLSLHRDGHAPSPTRDISGYDDLVGYLNELNAAWVDAMERVSTNLLMDMLDTAGRQLAAFVANLDPGGPAPLPVAWAGEEASENWFDIGRDYTELWHHQAQIRLAVDAAPLNQAKWLHPVLALAVRGVPRALGALRRTRETEVVVRLEGQAGGTWTVVSGDSGWEILEGRSATAAAEVTLPAEEAWRVFFNAASRNEVRALARCSGDPELCDAVLRTRSVMV